MKVVWTIGCVLAAAWGAAATPLSMVTRFEHAKAAAYRKADYRPRVPRDRWFPQYLDHFDHNNNQTWRQRYQVIRDYHKEGGPVFLLLGGEWNASNESLAYDSIVDYGMQFDALLFQLEHRFYGQSRPTSDLSLPSLRYLNSQQALADAAHFITVMTYRYHLPGDTRWVVFGGSYAGNLAAWLRDKYPQLVHAAVAYSAPVLAKVNFYEYMNVVKKGLSKYGSNCVSAIRNAHLELKRRVTSEGGPKKNEINKMFKLCDPLGEDTRHEDVLNLLGLVACDLGGVVQYNGYGYLSTEIVCSIMTSNWTTGDALSRYATVNSIMMDDIEEPCLDYKYDKVINQLRNTSWGNRWSRTGDRQWFYQTCNEFGYYQTSEISDHLFFGDIPLGFWLKQCADVYGDKFSGETVHLAVNHTNYMYGGLNISATRVVYVHGSLDPWHPLGITETVIPESPAILVEGASHCANIYRPSEYDLPGVTSSRQVVGTLLAQWLGADAT